MPNLSATINLDETKMSLSVTVDAKTIATIDYKSDVNFTQLIDSLSEFLDGEDLIEIASFPVTDDEKAKLTINIAKSVIENYNAAQSDVLAAQAHASINQPQK